MKVLTYQVTLEEPVLVTALGGDPNSGVAFDYLPGSVLRGAIIGAYQRGPGQGALDAGADEVRRLFFDGRTRYLNAYPVDPDDSTRACPVPRSWQQEKNEQRAIYDFAVAMPSDGVPRQWKHVRAPFYVTVPTKEPGAQLLVTLIDPARHISVHTTRTRRYGRAMPAQGLPDADLPGAVYRYDALACGQTFAAAILCEDDDAATLAPLLDGVMLLLGGARSAGYGRARVHDVDVAEAGWQEMPIAAEAANGPRLVVTLLSDLLLRAAAGQWTVDPAIVAGRIAAHLKLPEGSFTGEAYVAATVVGGFNRTWGLPLPQCPATAMGSVFLFTRSDATPEALHARAATGLGERRAEGFGRLACSWPIVPDWTLPMEDTPPHVHAVRKREQQALPPLPITDPATRDLAEEMAKRLLRRRLDAALRAAAARARLREMPSNAQLSRLRALLYAQLQASTPNLAVLEDYVADLSLRASARRQFAAARVDDPLPVVDPLSGDTRPLAANKPLLDWLRPLLRPAEDGGPQLPPTNWRTLFDLPEKDLQVGIGSVTAAVTLELRVEYTVRYVAAVLARAARVRGKEAN